MPPSILLASAMLLTVLITSFVKPALADDLTIAIDRSLGMGKFESAALKVERVEEPKRIEIDGRLTAGYNTSSKEIEVTDMSFIIGIRFNPRFFGVVDLDGRGALAKDKVRSSLKQNTDLRSQIEGALRDGIAAHYGIPASYVHVPPSLLDSTVNTFVDNAINDKAVIESVVRQAYVSVTALEGKQNGDGSLNITAGKVDPVYYNPDAHGHFATSTPTLRMTYTYNKWDIHVSAYNNRFGEDWNIDGTVVGQVSNILRKAGEGSQILDYHLNSYEVAVEKEATSLGRLIVAVGARNEGKLEGDSKYALVRIDPTLGQFHMSITASAEEFGATSKEAPVGTRYRLSSMLSRDISEKTRLWVQAYAGKQTGLVKKDQRAFIIGADHELFQYRRSETSLRASFFNAQETTPVGKKKNRGFFGGVIVRF